MRILSCQRHLCHSKLGGSEHGSVGTVVTDTILSGLRPLSLVSRHITPQPESLSQRTHLPGYSSKATTTSTSFSFIKGTCSGWSVSPSGQHESACYLTQVTKTWPSQTTLGCFPWFVGTYWGEPHPRPTSGPHACGNLVMEFLRSRKYLTGLHSRVANPAGFQRLQTERQKHRVKEN